MALKYAERVKETTINKPATNATAFDLGGARIGFRTFIAGLGSTHRCVYVAQRVDADGNPSGAWEVQVGAVASGTPNTLSRDYLIASSTGSFIDWSASGENASPEVFVTFPAGMGEGLFQPIVFPGTNHWWRPVTAPGVLISGAFAGINRIHVQPFFIPRPMLLKGLRAHQTGGAAAGRNLYLAFYRARGQANQVMERVAVSVELDGSITGEKSDTSISQFIEPGVYFSALTAESNAMQFAGVAATSQVGSLSAATLGVNDTAMTGNGGIAGYFDDGPAYGVPPTTITPDTATIGHQPVVEAKFELA